MQEPSDVSEALPVYRLRGSFHLGDRWARLNYAFRLIEAGERFLIGLPDQAAMEIVCSLDLPSNLRATCLAPGVAKEFAGDLSRRVDRGATAYGCRYFPTRIRHQPFVKKLGVCFTANWRTNEKIPEGVDGLLERLGIALPRWELLHLGKPFQRNVSELIDALAEVSLLLTVDNGIAHVARSVGTPLFILEHELPVSRGFPTSACEYTRVKVEDAVDLLVKATDLA